LTEPLSKRALSSSRHHLYHLSPFKASVNAFLYFNTVCFEFYIQFSCLSSLSFQGSKLLYCVENYGVTIVVGQTGCGKTTRMLPKIRL
jgi:hypothetical protein